MNRCRTPGSEFSMKVTKTGVSFSVTLPTEVDLSEEEAKALEDKLHYVIEETYSKYFDGPQYEHDCDRCEFQGRYTYDAPMVNGTEELSVDLWYCPCADPDMGGSVIARASSEGSDYGSSPVSIIESSYLPRSQAGERMSTCGPALVECYYRTRGFKQYFFENDYGRGVFTMATNEDEARKQKELSDRWTLVKEVSFVDGAWTTTFDPWRGIYPEVSNGS